MAMLRLIGIVKCHDEEHHMAEGLTEYVTPSFGQRAHTRGLLTTEGSQTYLSVGLIHVSQEKKAALVSQPVEADSGAHRGG